MRSSALFVSSLFIWFVMGECISSLIMPGIHRPPPPSARCLLSVFFGCVPVHMRCCFFVQFMDAIVVDTKAECLECLSYMQTNKVGTAQFIPLDSIKVKPIDESLRSLGPE